MSIARCPAKMLGGAAERLWGAAGLAQHGMLQPQALTKSDKVLDRLGHHVAVQAQHDAA